MGPYQSREKKTKSRAVHTYFYTFISGAFPTLKFISHLAPLGYNLKLIQNICTDQFVLLDHFGNAICTRKQPSAVANHRF
eukprot:g4672.t1